MKRSVSKNMAFLGIIFLATVTGAIFFWFLMSSTNPLSPDQKSKDAYTLIETNPEASMNLIDEKSIESQAAADSHNRTQILLGSWVKHHLISVENYYPDNRNWHLYVTFNDDGRFLWDSKRYESGGEIIDESLTGTYSVERGFLIRYKFDQPSAEAQKKLPELFAFWPNKLLGQQTFRFNDDFLSLGHDGAKIWLYLKRKDNVEQIAEVASEKGRR